MHSTLTVHLRDLSYSEYIIGGFLNYKPAKCFSLAIISVTSSPLWKMMDGEVVAVISQHLLSNNSLPHKTPLEPHTEMLFLLSLALRLLEPSCGHDPTDAHELCAELCTKRLQSSGIHTHTHTQKSEKNRNHLVFILGWGYMWLVFKAFCVDWTRGPWPNSYTHPKPEPLEK